MSEEIVMIEEEIVVIDTAVSPADTSRRVVMATVGVVVVAGEGMKSMVGKIIEQGGTIASDGRVSLPPRPSLRRQLRKPVNAFLNRMNIPTKTDIDNLNAQVTALLDKIEALHQQEQLLLAEPSTENEASQRLGD